MAAPIIRYTFESIHTGADMKPFGEGTPNVGVNYGDYTSKSWDLNGNKKALCKVLISYSGISWTLNADNSVSISGRITYAGLTRSPTGMPSNNTQDVWVWFGDPEVEVVHYTIGSSTGGTWDLLPAQYRNFSYTIPPSNSPQEFKAIALHYKNRNTQRPISLDETHPPDEFRIGLFITNPNKPVYRPGKVLDNLDAWQSHNRSGGAANIRTSANTWQTMPTSEGGVARDNPPFIRDYSSFINMRKIGENA